MRFSILHTCFLLGALSVGLLSNAQPYPAQWIDLTGVSQSGGVLTKIPASSGWTTGAYGSNTLSPNSDGWFEFTVTTQRNIMIGLAGNTSFAANTFVAAVNIGSGAGLVRTYEGSTTTSFTNVVNGDVFRVAREGTQINYYRNSVVFRTITGNPAQELQVRALIYSSGGTTPMVQSSTGPKVRLRPTISGTGVLDGTGSISVIADGGIIPYTYSWSSGESSNAVSNKNRGSYSITVTDADGNTKITDYAIGYRLSYINHTQVNEADGVLNKTNGAGWNAGANSANVLAANTDGWLEFVAGSGATYAIGFGNSVNEFDTDNFKNGIAIYHSTGLVRSFEGSTATSLGSWKPGDVFRISREGSTLKYYLNGVEIRSVSTNPALALWAKTSLNSGGGTPRVTASFDASLSVSADVAGTSSSDGTGSISLTVAGGASPYTYSWSSGETGASVANKNRGFYTVTVTDAEGRSLVKEYSIGYKLSYINLTQATESDGILTKTGGAGWNAGANSANILAANTDGWVEFVGGSGATYAIGFGNSVNEFGTNDFRNGIGIYHSTSLVSSFEGSTSTPLGSWKPGDIFRISREANTVKYYLNGTVIRSVTTNPALNLWVKTSLNSGTGTPRVTASFDATLSVLATVVGNSAVNATGSISLAVSGGVLPYTYSWSSGETTTSISNKNPGTYTVTVTDSEGRSQVKAYSIGYRMSYTNLTQVTESNGVLTKTGPTGWNAGANSERILAANTNGWLEFVVGSGSTYQIGFATNTASFGSASLLNGFRIDRTSGTFLSLEGSTATLPGSWVPGDVFRIAREGNSVKYYYNGVLKRTITVNPALTLMIKTGVYTGSSPLVNSSLAPAVNEGNIPDLVEFNSLKAIYDNLGGTGWTNNTNWPTTWPVSATNAQFATWYGVTVANGDIVALDLGNNNLVGAIPAGVGDLTALDSLDFGNNVVTGLLPSQLAALSGLRSLKLNNNSLTGGIPSVVTDLDSLSELDLSHNQFDGAIPTQLSNLGMLTRVSLAHNLLTGVVPSSLVNLPSLVRFDISENVLSSIGNFTTSPNKSNLSLFVSDNRLGFPDLTLNFTGVNTHPFNAVTYAPQKPIAEIDSIRVQPGTVLNIQATDPGAHGSIVWERQTPSSAWVDISAENEDVTQQSLIISDFQNNLSGNYRYRQTNTWLTDLTLESEPIVVYSGEIPNPLLDSTVTYTIPSYVKVTREGRLPSAPIERQFMLSSLSVKDSMEVFQAPPCLEGSYYAGFQLYYDLGDVATETPDWIAYLEVSLYHGDDSLWTKPLRVDAKGQTFIATAFYDSLISCDASHYFVIKQKQIKGNAPQNNIYLKVLLFKKGEETFAPGAAMELSCANSGQTMANLSWNFAGEGAIEYDLEWVFIADHENFTGSSPQDAFQFKEPARITTAAHYYNYLMFYPDGRVWHRARAVGYNPEFPDHRIPGHWSYSPCDMITLGNQQPDKNWQVQTVYAEEGKYKKVVHYFDGSLRERQLLTNMNSNNVTIVAETLYDFEGRRSVDILPVPVPDHSQSLTFKNSFNNFLALNPEVGSRTAVNRKKLHYDNYRLENSIVDDDSGAGWYYSPSNTYESDINEYIPDGEGYVYSQTEYLHDGTGRVARQSGVGKAFAQDGAHTTRMYYGNPAAEELIRLFGTNVGHVSHYKKNLAVDANGQVSVSYLDQEGRVIATALAGQNPANVDPLDSYTALPDSAISVSINDKNERSGGISATVHKILNSEPNTQYTFKYDLSAYASQVEQIGCEGCSFDLKITIADTEGALMDLSFIVGNQSVDGLSYERNGITAADCADPEQVNVEFDIIFPEIGDYTITKVLTPHELSFSQMQEIVSQNTTVQTKVDAVRNSYHVDPSECEICTTGCPEEEAIINEAINEIATLDCENILLQIDRKLRDLQPEDPDYEPSQREIQADSLYCKYQLCSKNKLSDTFEKQMARVRTWSGAVSSGYGNPTSLVNNLDPFFANSALSGYNAKSAMNGYLNDISLATINAVNYHGPILQVTNPNNTNYYIDNNGNHNPSGKHVLYLDLMNRRSEMGETAYAAELNEQRWTYFKGFYLEAKRKAKLTIAEYNTCPKAKADLEMPDQLPTTEDEIIAFGQANGVGGPVSEAEVEMSFYSIKHSCDTVFSVSDSTTIANHLQAYFNGNPRNLFRLIFRHQLTSDDHLIAIQNILTAYGCGLNAVAEDDPITCVKDTTLMIPSEILHGPGGPPIPFALGASTAEQKTALRKTEIKKKYVARAEKFNKWKSGKQKVDKQKVAMAAVAADTIPDSTNVRKKLHVLTKEEQLLAEKMLKDLDRKWGDEHSIGNAKLSSPANRKTFAEGLETAEVPTKRTPYVLPDDQEKIRLAVTEKIEREIETKFALLSPTSSKITSAVEAPLQKKAVDDEEAFSKDIDEKLSKVKQDAYEKKLKEITEKMDQAANAMKPSSSSKKVKASTQSMNKSMPTMSLMSAPLPSQAEYDALVALYASTNGAGWTNNDGWRDANPAVLQSVVGWHGLTTNGSGFVTHIDLSANNLSGTIPSSINDVCSLVELDLSENQLSGSIPSINHLTSLQRLELSSNQLTGTVPVSSMVDLTELVTLQLNHNQLNGTLNNFLPLPGLEVLELSDNLFTGTIPTSIGALANLRVLKAASNQLSNMVPTQLGSLINLEVLDLSHNNLSGYFRDEWNTLTNLTHLDLSYNQMYFYVPTWIGTLTNLTELVLNNNGFYGYIPMQLGSLTNLRRLQLNNNYFSGEIPSQLGNLQNLEVLLLNNNSLYTGIPVEFGNLTNLTHLWLHYNNVFGTVPSEFGNLTNLTQLLLSYNQLQGELPATLSNLSNLTTLWINNNQLSGQIPAMGSALDEFLFDYNQFTFTDLLGVVQTFTGSNISYAPQADVGEYSAYEPSVGQPFTLTADIDRTTSPASLYQWFKDNDPITPLSTDSHTVNFPSVSQNDGGSYYYTIQNPAAPALTLNSQEILVLPNSCMLTLEQQYTALMALYNSTNGAEWYDNEGWGEAFPADLSTWTGLETNASGFVTGIYLDNNNLTGTIPAELTNLCRLQYLSLSYNNLTGTIPSDIGNFTYLEVFDVNNNQLTGTIPASVSMMELLSDLYLSNNQLTGSIPAGMVSLNNFNAGNNQLTGEIPNDLLNISFFEAPDNQLTGTFPATFGNESFYHYADISNNRMSGYIPPNIIEIYRFDMRIYGNKFVFEDIHDAFLNFGSEGYPGVHPQDSVDVYTPIIFQAGQLITLEASVDRNTAYPCKYQWFKYVDGENDIALTPQDFDSHTYTIPSATEGDLGKYYYTIINDDPEFNNPLELVLVSRFREVKTQAGEPREICLEFDQNNPTLQKFRFTVNWNTVVQQCLADAAKEDSILIDYAIEKLIEEEITTFNNNYSTKCLDGASEALTYSYVPREYHYTLYYFDQAGNLTQTVPPQGVRPLTPAQVIAFRAGNRTEPGHTFVTRYQYNALNQVVWQKTPDGGVSQFWYDKKSQLRLSQNAQQHKDNNYAYTKYDKLGRVIEVGEMNTADSTVLLTKLDSLSFPSADAFALSDITRTHYDFAKPDLDGLQQKNLRTRVSYVEVIEKDQPDTIATYYTYDIHGNVTSLLQQVPGLENKRTDYVYDLVSGKVNYVMYEYDKADEFIHRYTYDADNRIVDVYTSSDGFIWDKDANYQYYLHGPLARVELGEYRVQGLDYIYTLQGWIKGVNGVLDPGADGTNGSMVPKDEYSYNIGYFKDDYKGIGLGAFSDSYQLPMQQYNELMGNDGLYNGNIAWMTTDLKKIGEIKGNRMKGMQAMLYRYDQLHRIMQSRSLTDFDINTGFAAKNSVGYDEDYTYDANGNIKTLQRRDADGVMKDNFNYSYYNGTNKLRQLIPVERDTIYNGGPVRSNQKVYRNISITGTSYIESAADVTLKATDNIDINEDFDVNDEASFHAYVLPEEEGMYLYDEIGNLIWDQEEGVRIEWTPYGKIRKVVKGDSTTVTFDYDGSGNRISKTVVKADTAYTTRYVRDASGNVMAVYKDTTLAEQPIYGSSRTGMYRTGRRAGHRTLGTRSFELSNHLGNVLVVVTDNIYMNADSTWANVASANDYYPFGLNMEGRSSTDSTYRYGFNGKEKDDGGEFGSTVYDYGFRIYNPAIGKFLSVDPLTDKYPWYTPYQFAGNKPIWAIDVDGLEEYIMTYRYEDGRTTPLRVIKNSEVQIEYTSSERFKTIIMDKRTGKPMDPKELGQVQYQYVDKDGNSLKTRRDYNGDYVPGANEMMPLGNNNLDGSIYIGPSNPTYIDDKGEVQPDYRREPQDAADAFALMHDKRYDQAKAAGAGDAFFNRGFPVKEADQKLVDGANDIIQGAKGGALDPVTGKTVNSRTVYRANMIKSFFSYLLKAPAFKGDMPKSNEKDGGTHVIK